MKKTNTTKKTTAKKVVKKTTKKPTAKKKTTKKKVASKKCADLVVVKNPVNPTQEFVVASEFADDEAIEADLMGKAMESYVYKFQQGGGEITGLTVAGVNEMSRQLTKKKDSGIKIRISPENIKIDTDAEMGGEKGVKVVVIAENSLTGETGIGAKFEPYKKKRANGSLYDNTFVLEKAVSKAERNAKRKLIPEKVAVQMINKFIKGDKVQEIETPAPYFLPPSNNQPQPVQTVLVNYLSKFIAVLSKEAGVIIQGNATLKQAEKMQEVYERYTGEPLKTFKVGQKEAEQLLTKFLNCPMMTNK